MKIPGVGENGIKCNLAGDPMIAVPDIAPVRVSSDYRLGFVGPYQAYNLLSEFRCIFERLVWMAQEDDLPHPQ